jgi:hypothetical protein
VAQPFAQGRDSLEDDEHAGRSRTELKIQQDAALVRVSRSQMVDEVTAGAGINHGTCHRIPSDDLNTSHVTQPSVPCVLKQDQLEDRMSACGDLIYRRNVSQ